MADQYARDDEQLSPNDVFAALNRSVFDAPRSETARLSTIREAIQTEYVLQLLRLAASDTPSASSLARSRLEGHATQWARNSRNIHRFWLARQIGAGLARMDAGEDLGVTDTDIPPGSPIGADSCWHCDSAAVLGVRE